LVAPLLGLDPTSLVIGLVVGLVAAAGFLVVRVLEPIDRGIDELNSGALEEDHPLRSRCQALLADAQSGRALVEALSGSADKNAISAAQVSFAADQLKVQLERQVQKLPRWQIMRGRLLKPCGNPHSKQRKPPPWPCRIGRPVPKVVRR